MAAERLIEIQQTLAQAIEAYRIRPHTPELITSFQRVLWGHISEIAGVDVVVPNVDAREQKKIEEGKARGKGVILVPQGYEGQDQRRLIAAGFKLLNNKYVSEHWSVVVGNPVRNDRVHVGYRLVDIQIDAPYLRTNEEQARELTEKGEPEEGSEGMNESEYLIASLQSKLLTGQYLDEVRTWTRLLSSSRDGRVVRTGFYPPGDFRVSSSLRPEGRRGRLGARFSSGVKTEE